MKYISLITILVLLLLVNSSNGQDSFAQSTNKNMRDSIENIVKSFGKSVDLYFEPGEFELSFPERENIHGYNLFVSLFDTTNFQENVFNFIDPKFVSMYIEAQEECKTCECWQTIFEQLRQNQNYKEYLSMREYIELYREIYLTRGISSTVLEGSFGSVDSSRILWNGTIERNFGKRYTATVSVPFTFGGVHLSEKDNFGNRQPINFTLEEMELFFEISFTKVKNSVGDFKIDKVSFLAPECPEPPKKKYLFSVTPFINMGSLQPDFVSVNSTLNNQLEIQNTSTQEIGLRLERKFKPFNKNYIELVIGTGAEFKRMNFTNQLNTYYENNSSVESPFVASEKLKTFTLNSQMSNTEFIDKSWMLGIPLRIGIGLPLKSDNSVRMYLNSGISYLLPLNSSSNVSGDAIYTGEFVYETNSVVTTILMNEENSGGPHDSWNYEFGEYALVNENNLEFDSGFEVKTQLGLTIPFNENYSLKFGGYLNVGSIQLKDKSSDLIFSPEGKVKSPLATTEKLNYIAYGLNLSVTLDFYKLVSGK